MTFTGRGNGVRSVPTWLHWPVSRIDTGRCAEWQWSYPILVPKVSLQPMNRMENVSELTVGRQLHLATEMARWLESLRVWPVVTHLTFRWEASVWSAKRCYEKFMAKELPHTEYFYSPEPNGLRGGGWHLHSLWFSNLEIERKEKWYQWFTRYGRARIEPVRSHVDVVQYCSKVCYVSKALGEFWGIKINNLNFTKGELPLVV